MAAPEPTLGVARGGALYVGSLMGPGVLLVPSLAAEEAGPASIVAWGALLVLSAPLAITFAALGVRHPVAGGVAAYVQRGFGATASSVVGVCFLTAVAIGAPAVALIGGYYVADLTGTGPGVAVPAAIAMFAGALVANAFGLQVSSGLQLFLSGVLVLFIAAAVLTAVPSRVEDHWTPFAPHGIGAVGVAANILVWLFIGWEAMAQMAGEFRDPPRDIPRAIAGAYLIVALLYVGIAVATITVTAGAGSRVPLADLLGTGLGPAGRDATAVLAVALTMGTMNVYLGAGARLSVALARENLLPRQIAGRDDTDLMRPLIAIAALGSLVLAGLGLGVLEPDELVRATSACFIVVYLLSLAAGVRILSSRLRSVAVAALALMALVAVFSATFLLVPALAGGAAVVLQRQRSRRASPRGS